MKVWVVTYQDYELDLESKPVFAYTTQAAALQRAKKLADDLIVEGEHMSEVLIDGEIVGYTRNSYIEGSDESTSLDAWWVRSVEVIDQS